MHTTARATGELPHEPRLAFSPEPFIERLGRLSVFQPRRDALLLHLAHPMMQRALGVLTRRRYPGGPGEVSRWTVRLGDVPDGVDAVVLLSIEELGVNELRETFHRWVRTLALPVRNGEIGVPLPHVPARSRRGACEVDDPDQRERAGVSRGPGDPAAVTTRVRLLSGSYLFGKGRILAKYLLFLLNAP